MRPHQWVAHTLCVSTSVRSRTRAQLSIAARHRAPPRPELDVRDAEARRRIARSARTRGRLAAVYQRRLALCEAVRQAFPFIVGHARRPRRGASSREAWPGRAVGHAR